MFSRVVVWQHCTVRSSFCTNRIAPTNRRIEISVGEDAGRLGAAFNLILDASTLELGDRLSGRLTSGLARSAAGITLLANAPLHCTHQSGQRQGPGPGLIGLAANAGARL